MALCDDLNNNIFLYSNTQVGPTKNIMMKNVRMFFFFIFVRLYLVALWLRKKIGKKTDVCILIFILGVNVYSKTILI